MKTGDRAIAAGVTAMPRMLSLRATAIVLAIASTTRAQDAKPDFAAPSELPAIVESPLSAPGSGPGVAGPPGVAGDDPVLLGPVEMQGPSPVRRPAAGVGAKPLTLESAPLEISSPEVHDGKPGKPSKPGDRSTGPRSITRPRILGRGPLAPRNRGRGGAGDSVVIEPKSDPAADGVLKRRLERQIRETLGDRVRSVEVLVVDRRVVIQAKSTRFWQRRAVRRSIEGLPDLVGYRATVHVDE